MARPLLAMYLVKLSEVQIVQAQAVNGERRRMTHALVIPTVGQMFGTEAQCRKYFEPWKTIFPTVIGAWYEVDGFEIEDFKSEWLTEKLIRLQDARGRTFR